MPDSCKRVFNNMHRKTNEKTRYAMVSAYFGVKAYHAKLRAASEGELERESAVESGGERESFILSLALLFFMRIVFCMYDDFPHGQRSHYAAIDLFCF